MDPDAVTAPAALAAFAELIKSVPPSEHRRLFGLVALLEIYLRTAQPLMMDCRKALRLFMHHGEDIEHLVTRLDRICQGIPEPGKLIIARDFAHIAK